jgi:hypothetical protein
MVLIVLTVFILRPLQKGIQGRMEELRDDITGTLENYLGRKITYSSIGPSFFGTLDIRNIRISGGELQSGQSEVPPGVQKANADPEPLLFISRFRISWSLLELLRGKPSGIRSLRIDRPVLNLDLERDRDVLDLIRNLSGSRDFLSLGPLGNLADLIPDKVLFRIRNGQGTLAAGANQYQARGLSLDISVEDRQITVQGKGRAGVSLAGFFGDPFTAQIALGISGSCNTSLDKGHARITVPSLSGDLFRLRSLGFDFTLENDIIGVRKLAGGGFDFSLDYGLSSGNLFAVFNCEKFSLRDFLSLQGTWKSYSPWLALALSGGAFFERTAEDMAYHIGLAGSVPAGAPLEGSFLEISLDGDEGYVDVERFHFGVPRPQAALAAGNVPLRGELDFRGNIGLRPLAPNGQLSLADFSLTGSDGLTADISLSTQGPETNLFGETVTLGTVELSAFDVLAVRSEEGLGFSLSALRFTGMESYGDVRMSTLSLEGSLNYEPRQVEASLLLDSFSVADLTEMAAPFIREPVLPGIVLDIRKNLAVTTEIFLTTDFEHVLYNAPRFIIVYEGGRDIVGLLSVSGTDQRFDLTEGRLTWADGGVFFNGYADFSNPRELTFSMMANYQDLSYFFEGMLLDGRSLSLQGSYGLWASITPSANGGYSGRVEAADFPIPFGGQYARLNLQSSLRYESPRLWSFDMHHLEVLDLFTPGSPGSSFRISGGVNQDGAAFPVIFFDDGKGPLNGQAFFFWAGDGGDAGLSGTLEMADERREERYALEARYEESRVDLALTASRAQLGRFFTGSWDAQANGNIKVTWDSVESFKADFTLNSLSARIQDAELRASALAELDNEVFTLRDLRLNYAGLDAVVPVFRVNRTVSRVETDAVLGGAVAGRNLDLAFGMEAGFAPSKSWLEFARALESIEGAIHISEARLDTLRSEEPFDFFFSRQGSTLSLSGGPRNMIRFQIDGSGDFYAGFSSPSPIRGSITGTITPLTIDARTPDLYIDLTSLWNFVPVNTDVVLAGGYINADLEIRGPLGDPEFFGRARGNSLRIRVPNFISRDILPIPFDVTIEGNEMTFGPVAATVGGGAGTAKGWFRFDRWIPNTFNMDIQVPHETPVPFAFDITGFLAQGLASGGMKLSMEDLVFGVTGDLTADATEISLNIDEISQSQGADMFADILKPVTLDLNVVTGRKVEFLWPSEFPILQASADMGTLVKVSADTLARRFSLTSDVKIRSGELFYFERSFYIRDGLLTFRENEIQFDPRISVRAEVRDRTNEGPVTISMIVDNAPLLSFTARFESSPPLSQMEILALLGQNLTGTMANESTGAIQRALMNSTDLLAQFSGVRRFERQFREFLRLDMLSFRTQVFQNLAFQAAGLQDPVDRINGVGNYFDNTTVFLGKYIGRDMFVQGMLSLRYDKNAVTWGGLGFTPVPDIGVELESPLFNIRWDFIPTHPENWYVDDNSITLTWTRSF